MGLFKRKKEVEEPAEPQAEVPAVRVKSPEEIQREQVENELEFLRAELKSKTEHLDSVAEKLGKAKEEYDQVVGSLMTTKKEINDRRTEIDDLRQLHQKIIQQISAAKTELDAVRKEFEDKKFSLNEIAKARSDVDAARKEYLSIKAETEEAKIQLQVVQNSYEESRKAQESTSQLLIKANSELEDVHRQIEGLKSEYESVEKETEARKKEIEMAKKELKFIEEQMSNVGERAASKNVVAAASSVVSSLNSKLLATQKELEIVKVALQRERAEHHETKKKLDGITKSESD